jgi:hypothetical protein
MLMTNEQRKAWSTLLFAVLTTGLKSTSWPFRIDSREFSLLGQKRLSQKLLRISRSLGSLGLMPICRNVICEVL